MRRRTAAKSSPVTKIVTAIGTLVGGGLVTYAGLNYAGLIDQTPPPPSRAGMIKVPKTQRAMTALTKVRREDVHTLALGDDSYFWMPKERVAANPNWIVNPSQIIGRVMARNKESELVFTEKDFLPKGSRTGISAGVPDGKQGFFVDAAKVAGLELLKMGDTFDLLASLPEEAQEKPEAEFGLLAGGIKVRGGKPIPLSGVRLLVQNAQMIAITRGRDMTTQSVMDLPEQDGRSRSRDTTIQITMAIDPEEVVPLTQALAAERTIHCVARSGQNSEQAEQSRKALDGLLPFPATARSMEAFTRITADDLADPDTGELRLYYFKPERTQDGWISSANDLIGRVVSRDTTAGFIFTAQDLLPTDAVTKDIKSLERIQATDLVDPVVAAEMIGRVAAHDISAGHVPTTADVLPANAVIRTVAAYTRIQPADLADPTKTSGMLGRVVGREIAAGQVPADRDLLPENAAILPVKAFARVRAADLADPLVAGDLIGRVTADDISQGTVINEAQLLPQNSSPGIAGGTPSDRMAISLDPSKVSGISGLSRGNRFDLVASVPFQPGDAFSVLGADVQVVSGAISQTGVSSRARNTVLAESAVVVNPGNDAVIIAVRPDEIASITKAITLETSIFALTRSGQNRTNLPLPASTTSTRLKSDPDPIGDFQLVEEMVGGKRVVRVFAGNQADTEN